MMDSVQRSGACGVTSGSVVRARWSVLHYINVGSSVGVGTAMGHLGLK